MADLRIVSLNQKIPYNVGKGLKIQALLSEEELQNLFEEASALIFGMEKEISLQEAVRLYGVYVNALKQGQEPVETPFAWYWTKTCEALYGLDTGHGIQIRPHRPVIQISHHQMSYIPEDNTFRSNLYGPETIAWGLQFSFPQLFQDPKTQDVLKVNETARFENFELFKMLQKWIRLNTLPTPFESVNASQRIGKNALEWVDRHPHLKRRGMSVIRNLKNNV